jgi:hypothetical protein
MVHDNKDNDEHVTRSNFHVTITSLVSPVFDATKSGNKQYTRFDR